MSSTVENPCSSLVTSSYTASSLMNSKPISSIGTTTFGFPTATPMCGLSQLQHRHGKAPPIGEFTTEDSRTTFDDWIPILECAANWNGWTADESLMQLAGHLRGRALQEWKLSDPKEKNIYQITVKALKERLDLGNQSLAALDFKHASQKSAETVSDFIQ